MITNCCFNTLEKVCKSIVVDNNESYYSHLLSEIITFGNDVIQYRDSTIVQEIVKKELESIGYSQSLDRSSLVCNTDIIDLLIRTRNNKKRLVLLEQVSISAQMLSQEKTKKLVNTIHEKTPKQLVEQYRSKTYTDKKNLGSNIRDDCSIINEPKTNILWLGKLSSENQIVLKDFIDNLLDVFQGTIIIHLPDKIEDGYVDLSMLNDRVKIITNDNTDKDLETIDLCVTTQKRSLLPSLLGIVTIIRPDYQTRYRNDRYIYSYELEKLEHIVGHDTLSDETIPVMGIKEVMSDVFCCENHKIISKNCKKYASNTLSLGLKLVMTEGIKRSKLLHNRTIRSTYTHFLLYHKKTKRSYTEYLSERNIKNSDKTPNDEDSWKREQIYWKRKDYTLSELMEIQNNFNKVISSIKENRTKIKVAFLVMFKQSFSFAPVFKKMEEDDLFDPFVIAIPNVSRSMVYQNNLYRDTFESLKKRFGDRTIHGYIERSNKYVELKDTYDVVVFTNPYDIYEHPFHNVKYFEKKNVLSIYINYGFLITKYSDDMVSSNFFGSIWKYILETEYHMDYYKNKSVISGINGLLTGFVKMDDLFYEEKKEKKRKTIIIAPHHTVVDDPVISLSNFIKYNQFFLELPRKYPEIDFIFRPHPLLFTHLRFNNIWKEIEIEEYLKKIDLLPNMIYDDSDYYFDKFANSDGIIHDCGSFTAEYLYTNKPCCYMVKNYEQLSNSLLLFAQKCLDCYYKASNEEQIIDYIESVIINGIDPLKEKRTKFSSESLRVNYPHSADMLIGYLKETLNP